MRNVWLLVVIKMISHCYGLEVRSASKHDDVYFHIEGHFGPSANMMNKEFDVVAAMPDLAACTALNPEHVKDKVVLIIRGPSHINKTSDGQQLSCRFTTKVYNAQISGAKGVIVGNNNGMHDIVPMYKDEQDTEQIIIPSMAVSRDTFETIYESVIKGEKVTIRMSERGAIDDQDYNYIVQLSTHRIS